MIVVLHAHPYPRRSRATAALLAAVRDLPGLEVRSLYDLYPDFDVDVAAEQQALERARLVVWLAPLYWYSVPALMKQWFDAVLVGGWAHGDGGTALRGKDCLWATTTGEVEKYEMTGLNAHEFAELVPALEQTARYCGMNWLEPFVLHSAHEVDEAALVGAARELRGRLERWSASHGRKA